MNIAIPRLWFQGTLLALCYFFYRVSAVISKDLQHYYFGEQFLKLSLLFKTVLGYWILKFNSWDKRLVGTHIG